MTELPAFVIIALQVRRGYQKAGGITIKPNQVKHNPQLAPTTPADGSLTPLKASPTSPTWVLYLKWEAKIALVLASLGLVIALHILNRFWQSLAALFSWRFEDILTRSTPFDNLTSPQPVFPLLMLVLWLQGAITLFWINNAKPKIAAITDTPKPVLRGRYQAVLIIAGLGLALLLGYGQRVSQLLPDQAGRLPASNYDEMVYFSGSTLLAQGEWPYRDFFLAHPPGAELLYATLLKLGGSGTDGYQDFLLARWGVIGLGLLTIVAIGWVAGRMWSRGAGVAIGPGLVAAGLYAADTAAAGVATLETPANFFAAVGLGCYLESEWAGRQAVRRGLWLGSGALLAFSTLCKLPGAALIFALLVYLLATRGWRALGWIGAGLVAGTVLLLGPFVLRAGPGEVLRQVVLFQLLRPLETREGKDQIARLADMPDSGLTIWLGGLALLLLACWLIAGGRDRGRWLIPTLWSLPLLAIFILSKSFHPWYYVQWALPLALLGAGLFSAPLWQDLSRKRNRKLEIRDQKSDSRNQTAKAVLPLSPQSSALSPQSFSFPFIPHPSSLILILLIGPLGLAQWQEARQPQYDRVYRPVGEMLRSAKTGEAVLTFDPGYSFMAGKRPVKLPATGKYLVDSAGYMVYLNLEMDRRGFFDLLGTGLTGSRERGLVDELFRQDRAQAQVVEGLSRAEAAVVDVKLALSQLTPRSVEFIGTGASKIGSVEYADLYRVRPLALRRPWRFDNGLWLTPFGLSTSLDGRANADPVETGEIIRLNAKEAALRSLDLRFVWRVGQPPAQAIKMFVHVVDESGKTVAQRDTAPLDDQADTRRWRVGDAYQDVHSLPLPANLGPGRYRVEIGLYDPATNNRSLTEGRDNLVIGYLLIN